MKNLVLLLASVVFSVIAAELVVRLAFPVREVGAVFSIEDPEVGKRLRPNLNTTRRAPEFVMHFRTNSEGFRGAERRGMTRPLLFLGDSFTMGYGVSDGFEFPAIVGARLSQMSSKEDIEVVNAGIGNNGNGQWVKFLRRNLHELDPSFVILQFMQNDFDDNLREGYFALTEGGGLIENEVRTSLARRLERFLVLIPGMSNSHLYAAIRQAYVWKTAKRSNEIDHRDIPPLEAEPNGVSVDRMYKYRLTESLIGEAVGIVKSGADPVMALIVGLDDIELDFIQGVFSRFGVPVLNIPNKAERPDLYYQIDGHWNEAGHEFVAEQVLGMLNALGYFEPRVP